MFVLLVTSGLLAALLLYGIGGTFGLALCVGLALGLLLYCAVKLKRLVDFLEKDSGKVDRVQAAYDQYLAERRKVSE